MRTIYIQENKRKDVIAQVIFIISMTVLFVGFIVLLMADNTWEQTNVFFRGASNYLADHFNVVNYSKDANPYLFGSHDINPEEHAYLPISYCIYYIISLWGQGGVESPIALMTANLFMSFCFIGLFAILCRFPHDNSSRNSLICFSLMLSGISLFAFERGNLIVLTVILCCFFILGYQSENKLVRELALVSLAFAAALKAYPALLGILLLYDKQWKEAVRLFVYGIIVAFLPFIFLKGGFYNIPIWLNNVVASNEYYTNSIFPRFGHLLFTSYIDKVLLTAENYSQNLKDLSSNLKIYMPYINIILASISIISIYYQKEKWKKLTALMLIIVILPINSAEYTGLYLFPAIVTYINHKKWYIVDYLFLVLFVIILNPIQIASEYITPMIMNIASYIAFVLIAIDGGVCIIKTMLSSKSNYQEL